MVKKENVPPEVREARKRATVFGSIAIAGQIILTYILVNAEWAQGLYAWTYILIMLSYMVVFTALAWPWMRKRRHP